MTFQTADIVAEPASVANENERDEQSNIQEEIQHLLKDTDTYQQTQRYAEADVPSLQITNLEGYSPSNFNLTTTSDRTQSSPQPETQKTDAGLFGVVGDIFGGAIQHVINNPLDVVKSVAVGAVLSIAIGAGIAGATALAATAPAWVPIAGTVALIGGALGVTGWMAAEHVPKWWKDADTVWNSSKHTDEEVAAAREGLQGLGGGTVDFFAGLVGGGWIYSQLTKTVANAATDTIANELRAAGKGATESTEQFMSAATEGTEQVVTAGGKAAAAEGTEQALAAESKAAAEGVEASTGQTLDIDTFFAKLQEMRGPKLPHSTYDDIAEVPEHLRGWATTNKVLALGAGHGVSDPHLAALKYLTDPREISYFANYISDDLTNPLIAAAEIRNAVSGGITNATTKQAWLEAASAIEEGALTKLLSKDVSKLTQSELAEHIYSIEALKTGRTGDVIMNQNYATRISELTAGKSGEEIAGVLSGKVSMMHAADAETLAFRSLTNPQEIDAYASFINAQNFDPTKFARTIRNEIAKGSVNPETLSAWSATASKLEAEAIPQLETILKSLDGAEDAGAAHMRSWLEGLKAGKTADVIEQEWRFIRVMEGNLARTATRLESQNEINLFAQNFAKMNPNFRHEIDLAIKGGVISEQAAPLWKEALEAIPSTGTDDILRASGIPGVAREGDELVKAMEEEARNTLLTTEEYAFTHLTNPSEIVDWVHRWQFESLDELIDFAKPLNKFLDSLQPEARELWLERYTLVRHNHGLADAFRI